MNEPIINTKLNTSTFLVKLCIAFLFHLFISAPFSFAQNKPIPEYQVKAAFLFNFTRFVDWPSDSFNSANAPFVIGIVGKDNFGGFIEELVKGENIKGHPIKIQRYKSAKEILHCHILFVPAKESAQMKETLTSVKDKSILTVSDAKDFVQRGGIVRFYKENNKIKLEINLTSANAKQLNISSKLLSVARIFDPGGN